jgi:hypothetical protein
MNGRRICRSARRTKTRGLAETDLRENDGRRVASLSDPRSDVHGASSMLQDFKIAGR